MNLKESPFYSAAKLMLDAMPYVAEEECFALKGGTAINFFVRDMPRLSVDIDLTYLPIEDRETSLENIHSALNRIAGQLKKANSRFQTQLSTSASNKLSTKIHLMNDEAKIKIEPNFVIRGSLFSKEKRDLSPKVQELFEASVTMSIVSSADLYGGKLCAALDRQHPRDLFDVKILFENEGITEEIRRGFLIYLASHDRTMSEVLEPTRKDLTSVFKNQFAGMTTIPASLDDLIETREKLISTLNSSLTPQERHFLLAIKEGKPKWNLLNLPGIEKLPALQWKLLNVKKMKKEHHQEALNRLRTVLKVK